MTSIVFFVAAIVAVAATGWVIFTRNIVHGLLSLVFSLLSVSLMIFLLGAPFAAALEVIIYAGAIMVLFVFGVMILGAGPAVLQRERRLLETAAWAPSLLLAILLFAVIAVPIVSLLPTHGSTLGPKEVGLALFGPYLAATILVSMLLLSGLVGAYHLGRREGSSREGAL